MEPIPETVEALAELEQGSEGESLLTELTRLAIRGREIVPDLVGVSIAPTDHGVTFTLVATAEDVAVLDAVQYAAGGPCVEGARTGEVVDFDHDVLDEERWRLFSEATAARTVRSTLTLPLVSDGRVVGTVNLYAASREAFAGNRERLAEVFGAWAEGAVANADLSFTTRQEAEATPRRVHEQHVIDVATGIVAAQVGVDLSAAEARLHDAAVRGGVSVFQLASDIVEGHEEKDRDEV